MQRIEVITSVERRRRYTAEEKKRIIEEGMQPDSSMSAVARKYGISPSLVFNWKRLMEKGQLTAVGSEEEVVPLSELKRAEHRVRELERLLGRKTMQVERGRFVSPLRLLPKKLSSSRRSGSSDR